MREKEISFLGSGEEENRDLPATPFIRAWICERPDLCAANSARVAYACLLGGYLELACDNLML